jgi:uncharacterized protein
MVDLGLVVGFDWGRGNARKSLDKHGVSQAEAEQIFFNEPLVVMSGERHGRSEARWHAMGHSDDGRLLHLTFTLRGDGALIRVISARDMSRKERIAYGQTK